MFCRFLFDFSRRSGHCVFFYLKFWLMWYKYFPLSHKDRNCEKKLLYCKMHKNLLCFFLVRIYFHIHIYLSDLLKILSTEPVCVSTLTRKTRLSSWWIFYRGNVTLWLEDGIKAFCVARAWRRFLTILRFVTVRDAGRHQTQISLAQTAPRCLPSTRSETSPPR